VETVRVTSSNARAVGYDYLTGEMRVEFRRGARTYSVPTSLYENLMAVRSKGRYFTQLGVDLGAP